jgi:hypothetical protein
VMIIITGGIEGLFASRGHECTFGSGNTAFLIYSLFVWCIQEIIASFAFAFRILRVRMQCGVDFGGCIRVRVRY